MLKVYLAQPRGFCAGVVRAIDIVDRALVKYGKPVYVRHEIVHNRHVVDALKSKGAIFVEDVHEIPDDAVTVFSAHGVAQSVVQEAAARKLPVIDATCPLVSKVHNQGKRYVSRGRTLVLIGHAGHPEVEGTMGQVGAPVHLISSEADALSLDLPLETPIAYVTQTTLSVDDTKGVIAALKSRFPDVVGPDTADICYATQHRQSATRDLSSPEFWRPEGEIPFLPTHWTPDETLLSHEIANDLGIGPTICWWCKEKPAASGSPKSGARMCHVCLHATIGGCLNALMKATSGQGGVQRAPGQNRHIGVQLERRGVIRSKVLGSTELACRPLRLAKGRPSNHRGQR